MTKNLQFGYFETEELKDVYKFKNIGKNVRISKAANIVGSENISLGNNIRIDNFTNIICKNGYINIGDHNHVASGCFILGTGGVEMGDFVGLAMGVQLISSSDNFREDLSYIGGLPIDRRDFFFKDNSSSVSKHGYSLLLFFNSLILSS